MTLLLLFFASAPEGSGGCRFGSPQGRLGDEHAWKEVEECVVAGGNLGRCGRDRLGRDRRAVIEHGAL